MAQRPIREYDAKRHLSKFWDKYFPHFNDHFQAALIENNTDLKHLPSLHSWLNEKPLVVKPDMLFGKRGLNNLVYLKNKELGDVDYSAACQWIEGKKNKETTLKCHTTGALSVFLIEPFTEHQQQEEYYISCTSEPEYDILYLSAHGGVEVEQNWDSVNEIKIPLDASDEEIKQAIANNTPLEISEKETLTEFAVGFYQFYKDLHFSYLELNPFILRKRDIYILDVVARLDDTARFIMQDVWDNIPFPKAFGEKEITEIEQAIQKLDEKSGASLKLSILNPEARVWTLVAGGGASVVYADAIADIWGVNELANYGEYSGNPTTEETYTYTKGVLRLMTEKKDSEGRNKILIIGGAIANFTDVAKTFDGIIKAFNEMYEEMRSVSVQIYVRRGGPNYEIGLKNIEMAATRLGLPIQVYGPETHLTDIVRQANVMQNEGVNV